MLTSLTVPSYSLPTGSNPGTSFNCSFTSSEKISQEVRDNVLNNSEHQLKEGIIKFSNHRVKFNNHRVERAINNYDLMSNSIPREKNDYDNKNSIYNSTDNNTPSGNDTPPNTTDATSVDPAVCRRALRLMHYISQSCAESIQRLFSNDSLHITSCFTDPQPAYNGQSNDTEVLIKTCDSEPFHLLAKQAITHGLYFCKNFLEPTPTDPFVPILEAESDENLILINNFLSNKNGNYDKKSLIDCLSQKGICYSSRRMSFGDTADFFIPEKESVNSTQIEDFNSCVISSQRLAQNMSAIPTLGPVAIGGGVVVGVFCLLLAALGITRYRDNKEKQLTAQCNAVMNLLRAERNLPDAPQSLLTGNTSV